jgi:hypothetical protein
MDSFSLNFDGWGTNYKVPITFTAPGDVAGMNFQELSGIGMEVTFRPGTTMSGYLANGWQLQAALPVLRQHLESRQPLSICLLKNKNMTGLFRMITVNRIEPRGTYQKIEWTWLNQ